MDTTKLKGLWGKIKDFFKNMSTKLRIILAVVLAVILIAVIALVITINQRNSTYVQLYQDLTVQEASEVADYLRSNGYTNFQLVGGTALMVRADQYESLLGQLALAGYPKDASLYGTYFENVGMMTTTSQAANTFRIATQQKLEGIVRGFSGVQSAEVIITPGADRTFVLQDSSTPATAAVKVWLRSGVTLDDQTAYAIRLLVSKGWEGLTIENVALGDQWGNTYEGSGSASSSDAAELQRYLEQYYANRIRTAVVHLLEPIYGPDNVRVSPNVQIEVDRGYRETTSYNQPEGSYESAGLIGREIGQYVLNRDGYQLVGGVPGTTTNADIPTYVYNEGQNAENGDSVGTYYERDNKIDETKEQWELYTPRITNVTIGLTINQDGNRNAGISLEDLRRNVALTAGLGDMTDEELQGRVSVLMASFYTEPAEEPVEPGLIPQELLPYVIIGAAALLLLLIILIVVLVLRSKKKKKQQEEDQKIIEEQISEMGDLAGLGLTSEGMLDENGTLIGAPPPDGGADIMDINTERSMELRQSVRKFVESNPEVAASMLKTWLRGGEDSE